jgi:hypothetical protein
MAALMAGNFAAVGRDLVSGPAKSAAEAGYGRASFPTDADAPEYLPNGLLGATPEGPAPVLDIRALAAGPVAAGPRVAGASADAVTGAVHVSLVPGPPALVVVRRFFFPAWRVACGRREMATLATTHAHLVGFVAPAGDAGCEVSISATTEENNGGILTAASLGLLAVYSFLAGASLLPRR